MEFFLAPLLCTIVSIIFCVAKRHGEIQELLSLANSNRYLPYIIVGIILFIVSMQAGFLVPVSKEGKYYILSRTLPIKYELQYKAKSLYIFIMSAVSSSIAYWVFVAAHVFVWENIFLQYIILLEVLFLLAFISSLSDYSRPYIEWEEPRKATNGNLMLMFGILHVFTILAIVAVIVMGILAFVKVVFFEKLCIIAFILIIDIWGVKWNKSRIGKKYKKVQI